MITTVIKVEVDGSGAAVDQLYDINKQLDILRKQLKQGGDAETLKAVNREMENLKREAKATNEVIKAQVQAFKDAAKEDIESLKRQAQAARESNIERQAALKKLETDAKLLSKEMSAWAKENQRVEIEAAKATAAEAKKTANEKVAALKKIESEFAALIREEKSGLKGAKNFIELNRGSYVGLNAELVSLRKAYKQLSEEERAGRVGQQTLKDIQRLDTGLKTIDASMGQYQRNVGNYKSAFDGFFGGLTRGAGIITAITGLSLGMTEGVQAAALYSKSFADLQAILGVTGKEADDLEKKIGELTTITLDGGEVIVNTAAEIATAMKVVGSQSPQLLENSEALAQVTKEALILAKASGDGLEPSAAALTKTMNQFNLSADESNRIINALAAGSKAGAAEIPQITDAMKEAGLAAKNSGVSLEESIGLIETLAERGLQGAEAGTQLRNVFIKLASAEVLPKKATDALKAAGVDLQLLSDKTIPFTDRLKELSKVQGNVAVLAKVFGAENLAAAQILTENVDRVNDFTAAVTGTNTAYEQAAINADSFDQSLTNLKNTLTNIMVGVVNIVVPALSGLINILQEFPDDIAVAVAAMASYQLAMTGMASGTSIAAAATRLLTVAMNALPFVAVAATAVILYEAIKSVWSATQDLTTVQEDLNTAVSEGISNYAQEANAADALFDTLRDETKSKEEKKAAVDALNKQYGQYLGNLDLEKATVEELNTAQNNLNNSLIESIVVRIKKNEAERIANEIFKQQTALAEASARQQKFANDTYIQGLTGTKLAGRNLAAAQRDAATAQATIKELEGGLNRLNTIGEEFRATLAKTDISVFGTATATKALGDAATVTGDKIETAGGKTEKAAKSVKDMTTTLAEMEAALKVVEGQLKSYNDANQIPKEVFEKYDSLLKQIADLKARLLEFKGGMMDSEVSLKIKVEQGGAEQMQGLEGVTESPDVAAEIARQNAEAEAEARIEVYNQMFQTLQDQAISLQKARRRRFFKSTTTI